MCRGSVLPRAAVGLARLSPSLRKRNLETVLVCPVPSEQCFLLKAVVFLLPKMATPTLLSDLRSFSPIRPILTPLVAEAPLPRHLQMRLLFSFESLTLVVHLLASSCFPKNLDCLPLRCYLT